MNIQKEKETPQTRKANIMTKKDALIFALNAIAPTTEDEFDAVDTLRKMLEQLSKPRTPNEAAKDARKEATAKARANLVAQVAPILRKHLTANITAKELFAVAKDELPADFSAPKVQNILIREMAPELIKTEVKGKANTYRLA